MARPSTEGLEYFPLDVDFWDDPKILLVEENFGIKGSYIANRLLCWIYRNGYYLNWSNEMSLVFAKRIGHSIPYSMVNDVVSDLVKNGFFNKLLFEKFDILTSNGIQKRWIDIIKRAKRKCEIDINYRIEVVSSEETPPITELTPPKVPKTPVFEEVMRQSKVKERKGNSSSDSVDVFQVMRNQLQMTTHGDELVRSEALKFANKYRNEDIKNVGALIGKWVSNIPADIHPKQFVN